MDPVVTYALLKDACFADSTGVALVDKHRKNCEPNAVPVTLNSRVTM